MPVRLPGGADGKVYMRRDTGSLENIGNYLKPWFCTGVATSIQQVEAGLAAGHPLPHRNTPFPPAGNDAAQSVSSDLREGMEMEKTEQEEGRATPEECQQCLLDEEPGKGRLELPVLNKSSLTGSM